MKKKPIARRFRMSIEAYEAGTEEYEGRCLACGTEAYGVEPDAEGYACEECQEEQVYGLEQLLIMGRIIFKDED